jgi:hypothetical protein
MTEAPPRRPRRVSQYQSAHGPTIEALKTSTAYQGMVSAKRPCCVHLKVAICLVRSCVWTSSGTSAVRRQHARVSAARTD